MAVDTKVQDVMRELNHAVVLFGSSRNSDCVFFEFAAMVAFLNHAVALHSFYTFYMESYMQDHMDAWLVEQVASMVYTTRAQLIESDEWYSAGHSASDPGPDAKQREQRKAEIRSAYYGKVPDEAELRMACRRYCSRSLGSIILLSREPIKQ